MDHEKDGGRLGILNKSNGSNEDVTIFFSKASSCGSKWSLRARAYLEDAFGVFYSQIQANTSTSNTSIAQFASPSRPLTGTLSAMKSNPHVMLPFPSSLNIAQGQTLFLLIQFIMAGPRQPVHAHICEVNLVDAYVVIGSFILPSAGA